RREAPRRDGEVQRGAGQGRRDARGRRAAPELEGRARPVLGCEAHRHRRALRRDQGAGRRLLDLAGEVEGRGDRMGQALPQSDAGGFRDRDPPGIRGGGLRRRVHARAEGAGGAPARADSREEEKVAGGAGPGTRVDFTGLENNMRFMMIVKATKDSEAGVMPSEKLISDMQKYHEELQKAGVLLDASGLKPSSKGWRVKYSGAKRTVIDGPFAEAKELIAGYTIIQVKSREEAREWARRFPN